MNIGKMTKAKREQERITQTCGLCRYYLEYDDYEGPDPDDPDAPTGVCRRFPPRTFAGSPTVVSLFPDVSATTDWCGEYLPAATEAP